MRHETLIVGYLDAANYETSAGPEPMEIET
jgi:hypothetical protein